MTKSTADKEVKKVTDRIQKTIKKDTDRHKRYLSRTEKVNQSKSPVKVHEQVIPLVPSQANSSSGSSTIAKNSNNMAAYLGKLSDDEKRALEADTAKRIAEEVAKVAAGFKVTVTNHAIPTPVYDKSKITSTHFFSQVEKYLRSQHHKEQDFVYLFGTLLKSDEKLWYDNSVTDATTWDALKLAFKKMFDTSEDKDKREKI
ncbi:unnamed protein product, partial [Allacma fusca]